MVIEDDEVEESRSGDDSSDEDWGKNEVVEDAGYGEEEDMELEDEEDEEDVAERSKSKEKPSRKVEPRKRKLGGAEELGTAKKGKNGAEVGKGEASRSRH